MPAINESLSATRAAVDEVIRTANNCGATWTTPRAPGKWSPSFVVEHVAISLEASADDLEGRPSALPKIPAPFHWLIRLAFFNRVMRTGKFPKAKTNAGMVPSTGPATPADAATRLDAAWKRLAAASSAAAARGDKVKSQTFGSVLLTDYVRFQEYHTRHHQKQMIPTAAPRQ
jgi:hypothetical protein